MKIAVQKTENAKNRKDNSALLGFVTAAQSECSRVQMQELDNQQWERCSKIVRLMHQLRWESCRRYSHAQRTLESQTTENRWVSVVHKWGTHCCCGKLLQLRQSSFQLMLVCHYTEAQPGSWLWLLHTCTVDFWQVQRVTGSACIVLVIWALRA